MTTQNCCNTYIVASATNEVTMPLHPAFLAFNSTTDLNATGNGTAVTPVEYDSEVFDQNADYDNGTDTFTAPVTGKYHFILTIKLLDFDGTQNFHQFRCYTTLGQYRLSQLNPAACDTAANELTVNGDVFADMDAADTCVSYLYEGQAGNKVVDIYGNATNRYTSFAGYLKY